MTGQILKNFDLIVRALEEKDMQFIRELAESSGVNRLDLRWYISWLAYYDVVKVKVKANGKAKLIMLSENYKENLEKLKKDWQERGIVKVVQ